MVDTDCSSKIDTWQWQMMPCCNAPASIRSRSGQASACFSGGVRRPVPFFSSDFPIFHAQCVSILMFSPFSADTLMVILSTTCCSSFFLKDGFPLALATIIMCGFLSCSLVTYVQQNANQNQYPCRLRVCHFCRPRCARSLLSSLNCRAASFAPHTTRHSSTGESSNSFPRRHPAWPGLPSGIPRLSASSRLLLVVAASRVAREILAWRCWD